MRLALFSDIHGNIVGLQAVFAKLAELGGADMIFCLGDLLAIGPGTEDVLELLHKHQTRIIRGNWDEIFIDPQQHIQNLPPHLQAATERQYAWLDRHVSRQSQDFIARLPLSTLVPLGPERTLYLCHAAPMNTTSPTCRADTDTALLRATYGPIAADVIAYGHYHAHHVLQLDQKLLINVASVGMTYGKPSAFTILDYTDERLSIQQYQVPYDTDAFARLSRARGVPQE